MSERRPLVRIIPSKELAECPAFRLDPSHYIPKHKTWECRHGTRLRSRGALIKRPRISGNEGDSF